MQRPPTGTGVPPRGGYNPVLDGLRAVAVVAVIGDHAGFHTHGFHGVTVFFVVSGYLITTLMMTERDSSGSVSLRRFYWRRLIRLGPALAVVLLVTVGWLLMTGQGLQAWWAGPLGALTWSMDLVQAVAGNGAVGIPFQWSWSLGVEEQFYLVWPIAFLLVEARWRRPLLALLLAVAAAAWLVRGAEIASGAPHDAIFFGPATHCDALVLGVLVALCRPVLAGRLGRLGRALVGAAGLVGGTGLLLLEFRVPFDGFLDGIDPDGFGQSALFATAVVVWAASRPRGPVAALLGSRPVAFTGRLSYALYLWNILTVLAFVRLTGVHPAQTPAGAGWAAALLALALLSHLLVEQPLRRRWSAPAFLSRPARASALPTRALARLAGPRDAVVDRAS